MGLRVLGKLPLKHLFMNRFNKPFMNANIMKENMFDKQSITSNVN